MTVVVEKEVEFLGTDVREKGFRNLRHAEYEAMYSSFRCLFFHTRKCPIREQMSIKDDELQKGRIITEEIECPIQTVRGQQEWSRRKQTRHTADWLVNNFCRICPHREA